MGEFVLCTVVLARSQSGSVCSRVSAEISRFLLRCLCFLLFTTGLRGKDEPRDFVNMLDLVKVERQPERHIEVVSCNSVTARCGSPRQPEWGIKVHGVSDEKVDWNGRVVHPGFVSRKCGAVELECAGAVPSPPLASLRNGKKGHVRYLMVWLPFAGAGQRPVRRRRAGELAPRGAGFNPPFAPPFAIW